MSSFGGGSRIAGRRGRPAPAAAQEKQPPYWASIASGQAMTHTGPGKNYPGVWLYQRRDLPVRVVKKYRDLAADPGPRRSAGLDAGHPAQRPPHRDRQAGRSAPGPRRSRTTARKSATKPSTGVVGRISKCRDGWCRIEIGNRDRLYPHVRHLGCRRKRGGGLTRHRGDRSVKRDQSTIRNRKSIRHDRSAASRLPPRRAPPSSISAGPTHQRAGSALFRRGARRRHALSLRPTRHWRRTASCPTASKLKPSKRSRTSARS